MSELPVAGMKVEFPCQIRPNAASAPKLWIIIFRFPWFGRRSKTPHICRERPDLLRMTVSATFASIDNSAPLFGGGERCHGDWSHPLDLIFQFFSRNNRKNEKRQSEETYTGAEG